MFFELSAELRNKIYEEILLQRDYYGTWREAIALQPRTGFEIPSILQSCRQIRNEAAQLYFKQNRFVLDLQNCNVEFLREWMAMAVRYVGASSTHHKSPACEYTYYCVSQNRKNILEWCRLVRTDELPVFEPDDDNYAEDEPSALVEGAHHLAV